MKTNTFKYVIIIDPLPEFFLHLRFGAIAAIRCVIGYVLSYQVPRGKCSRGLVKQMCFCL